ncbi:hypothetical protein LR48_Vigan528s001300 [Vigna angularis]|uniref:Uncharacterized protein n=2 Tax=Phaseolus angularis TaxID=3914 RepID=A0A0L9TCU1_PHAAN|nr:hypothetical protein LR48_Vigan528s001300 [Vigna angularis]BAT89359.1 hypothetical protein VIGAN_06029900 [Vigna angularis var. angularis]
MARDVQAATTKAAAAKAGHMESSSLSSLVSAMDLLSFLRSLLSLDRTVILWYHVIAYFGSTSHRICCVLGPLGHHSHHKNWN